MTMQLLLWVKYHIDYFSFKDLSNHFHQVEVDYSKAIIIAITSLFMHCI